MARPRERLPRFKYDLTDWFFDKRVQAALNIRYKPAPGTMPQDFLNVYDPLAWPIHCYDIVRSLVSREAQASEIGMEFAWIYQHDPEFICKLLLSCQKMQDEYESQCSDDGTFGEGKTWTMEQWVSEYHTASLQPNAVTQLRRRQLGITKDKPAIMEAFKRDRALEWKEIAGAIEKSRHTLGLKPFSNKKLREKFSELNTHRSAVLNKWKRHIQCFFDGGTKHR